MILRINLKDNSGRPRGAVRVRLDWDTLRWTLEEDAQQVWPDVGFTPDGPFEPKDWTVIWLWDRPKLHNTLIIWDAPKGEGDAQGQAGQGRIFDPQKPAYKEGRFDWARQAEALSPLRRGALAWLD